MIQLLTEQDADCLLKQRAEHPQVAKIQALLSAYGITYDFCRFYRQSLGEGATAYLCRLDHSGVLWVGADADVREWYDFAGMTGFTEISVAGEKADALRRIGAGFDWQSGSVFVKYISQKATDAEQLTSVSLSEVFAIVKQCFPNVTDKQFDSWYCDISHRIRHGVCKAFLYRDAAAAVVLHYGNTAIISQLCVLPKYRGRGIGSELMQVIENSYGGCCVVVFSKDERSDAFYRKNRFQLTESWLTAIG